MTSSQNLNSKDRHESSPAPKQRNDNKLNVEILEERIAPFYWGSGSSWFSSFSTFQGIIFHNRCETLVGE